MNSDCLAILSLNTSTFQPDIAPTNENDTVSIEAFIEGLDGV